MSFTKKLVDWYEIHKRDLPWRHTKAPYNVWLSEIILQQTRVIQGLPYYEKILQKYPNIFELANSSQESFLKYWQGLGYYSRARNLHQTAQEIAFQRNGIFPKTYKELLKLKGVGVYTASAIASFCYKEKIAVVDGNVYRVLSRYLGINIAINSPEGILIFNQKAQELLDRDHPDIYNQAIMEFGALQCTPKKPNCMFCPMQDNCVAFATNNIENLPVKFKKVKVKKRFLNYVVFQESNKTDQYWIQKRIKKDIWLHLFEFPLIESKKSIDITEFFELFQREYPNINITHEDIAIYQLDKKIHKLTHQHLEIQFFSVKITKGSLSNDIRKSIKINIEDIDKYAFPKPIEQFFEIFEPKKHLQNL